MQFSLSELILWAVGTMSQVVLLYVLLVKRRARLFPIFSCFIGFEILKALVLYVLYRLGSRHEYAIVYWLLEIPDYALQMGLLFEIALDILRPGGQWVRDARKSFLLWGSVGLVTAAVIAMFIGPPEAKGLDLWNVRTSVFTSLLISGLFISLSASANRLGLQRRSYIFALGLGLTIWAFSSLVENFSSMVSGSAAEAVFSQIRMWVYCGACLYWSWVFWWPEKERAPLRPEQLVALHERVQYDLDRVNGGPPQ